MSEDRVVKELHKQVDKGTLQHTAPIPYEHDSVHKWLMTAGYLSPKERKLIFTMVHSMVDTLNQTGMNKWFPDVLKKVMPELFTQSFITDTNLIKLIHELQDGNTKETISPTV